MTNRLDERARQAAAEMRRTVADADLRLMTPPGSAPRPGFARPVWSAVGGAVAGLVLLVGLWATQSAIFAPEVGTPETTTTTVAETTTSTVPDTSVPSTTAALVPETTAATTTTTLAADVTPPAIEILAPAPGQVFENKWATFEGTTEPGAIVAAGPFVAEVDAQGHWSILLVLNPGKNTARFTATDAAGNVADAAVTVQFSPPTTTKPTEPPLEPFVAHFTWGECNLVPPYDEYYGSGEPGSTIFVTSEWGSGTTTVGPGGEWYIKVEFPEAPLGTPFAVKVKDGFGRKQFFEFTAVGA